jgi:carboxyl-terminal processing protease
MIRNRSFLTITLALLSLFAFAQKPVSNNQLEKLQSVIQIINYAYVDTVSQEKLIEHAIVGMLDQLDPHSVYISKEEVREMNEPLEGNFEGIGIQFNILRDTITVVATIPGGPSEKLGIMAGDKIVKIEGQNVAGTGIKNNDVLKKLRGNKGTRVSVSIMRQNDTKLLDYTITRDKIPIFSVDATYMATPTVGYIKLNRFAQTTMEEFRASLKKLKEAGMKDLILDLSDNGGGYLNTAIDLADEFLEDRKLIVYTQGVYSPKQMSYATSRGDFEKGKLVVLINENSASASEIVSGAVQDWDRGIVIGRRSFGKGLVQKPFSLPDGSMIRLTTAKYYTPIGRNIQKPYEKGHEEYYKDIYNRFKHGELVNKDSINLPDSLKFYTPNKRLVFGGGGIMPDIFIPLDTTKLNDYHTDLLRKGTMNKFSFDYVNKNRQALLKTYPKVDDFKKNFKLDKKIFDDLIATAEKDSIKRNEKQLDVARSLIETEIRSLIARDLYNNEAFYEVYNETNPSYQKALEVLRDNSFFKKLKINTY